MHPDEQLMLRAAVLDLRVSGDGNAGHEVFAELLGRHERKPGFKKKLNVRRNLR